MWTTWKFNTDFGHAQGYCKENCCQSLSQLNEIEFRECFCLFMQILKGKLVLPPFLSPEAKDFIRKVSFVQLCSFIQWCEMLLWHLKLYQRMFTEVVCLGRSYSIIVRVRVVLKRTIGCDWCFSNLHVSGSHLQGDLQSHLTLKMNNLLRLSKCQSQPIVLFRTTLTRTTTLYAVLIYCLSGLIKGATSSCVYFEKIGWTFHNRHFQSVSIFPILRHPFSFLL